MELSKRILEHKDAKPMYMNHMNKSISDDSEEFEDDKEKLSPKNKKLEILSEQEKRLLKFLITKYNELTS
jgi:uncharacterized FlgJ-related protein